MWSQDSVFLLWRVLTFHMFINFSRPWIKLCPLSDSSYLHLVLQFFILMLGVCHVHMRFLTQPQSWADLDTYFGTIPLLLSTFLYSLLISKYLWLPGTLSSGSSDQKLYKFSLELYILHAICHSPLPSVSSSPLLTSMFHSPLPLGSLHLAYHV